jgi:3-phenylpropionate/trans-cinnamate dioxygenase ferredoxin subunit
LKLVGRVARAELLAGDFVRLAYPPWHVLVALVDGAPYAIEDSCNHAGASLVEGPRDGDNVVCPMHGYIFSLRTGELLAPKGLCDRQRTFVTTVEEDDVLVWDTFTVQILAPRPLT